MAHPHPHYTTFGPKENCTLTACPIEWTIYQYRPSLPANIIFLVLFALCLSLHVYQGLRWRTWAYLFAMFWGCVAEIIGYAGRIMMWQNPFSFDGFLTQIVCLTIAPAFFSAAVYLTLSKIVTYLNPSLSRFRPALYYYIFIPCDLVSLTLQAAGGAMSTNSEGANENGVNIAIAGLSFQVFTLSVFVGLALDYAVRFLRHNESVKPLERNFKVFLAFLSLATILILVRCIYRIDELSDGYSGALIHDEGLFIGLEGVMIIVAAFALNICHPGPIFANVADRYDVENMETKN